VSWLQSIPFRIDRDEELLTILMMGDALYLGLEEADHRAQEGFFECFSELLGAGDDWDIVEASRLTTRKEMADIREHLRDQATRSGKRPQINDLLAFAPEDPRSMTELGFRIISPRRTPDAILFGRTTDIRVFHDRPFPSGLEICVALDSSLARSFLSPEESGMVLGVIDAWKPQFASSGVYCEYLRCLASLLDEAEPDAPALFHGDPWRRKSIQSALAGWAQMRHTWALQAKETLGLGGGFAALPAFVEPDPEFFARLGRLVRRIRGILEARGMLASDLRRVVPLLRDMARAVEGYQGPDETATHEVEYLRYQARFLARLMVETFPDPRFAVKITNLANEIEVGEVPKSGGVEHFLSSLVPDLGPLWTALEDLARQLEVIAHKQLRRVPLSKEEERFLQQEYGPALGAVMLYGGNSYLIPRDDAPRATSVFSDPLRSGKHLMAAVGRPRALYVLYPVEGGEVLCRGAVLPYHEFQSESLLNDSEWMTLLGSKDAPDLPSWVRPIISASATKDPEQRRR
jgi:uncharacterized protein DUF3160